MSAPVDAAAIPTTAASAPLAVTPVTFTNTTTLTVLLATWQTDMPGLSTYRHVEVAPGAACALPPSCTGEYIVESERYARIGKFRLSPAADRRYSWTESDEYDIAWLTASGAARPQEYRLVRAR